MSINIGPICSGESRVRRKTRKARKTLSWRWLKQTVGQSNSYITNFEEIINLGRNHSISYSKKIFTNFTVI